MSNKEVVIMHQLRQKKEPYDLRVKPQQYERQRERYGYLEVCRDCGKKASKFNPLVSVTRSMYSSPLWALRPTEDEYYVCLKCLDRNYRINKVWTKIYGEAPVGKIQYENTAISWV